jgi:hypothetical protein
MRGMTEDTALDTSITEPSMTAGEAEILFFALERARAQFAWKCGDLDAAGLSKPHPPSVMTLGGLLKHVALMEDHRTDEFLAGHWPKEPWQAVGFDPTDPDGVWRSAADDSPEELYALWRGAVERSRAAWAKALANGNLDQPSRFVTESGESPNLRRALIDLIEEYIRHTGHADLLREAVDGLVGEDPPQ